MPLIAGTRQLATVATWKPLVATGIATIAWAILTARPSTLWLSLSAAGVGAATAPLLDDPAASTLQPSPTTLMWRRAHRAMVGLAIVGTWWAVAAAMARRSSTQPPLAAHALQLAAFVALGLAASSVAVRLAGVEGRGGVAGAVAALVCCGSGFLPRRWLQLVPVDPDRPGVAEQLIVVTLVAVALLLRSSVDPARSRTSCRAWRLAAGARGR